MIEKLPTLPFGEPNLGKQPFRLVPASPPSLLYTFSLLSHLQFCHFSTCGRKFPGLVQRMPKAIMFLRSALLGIFLFCILWTETTLAGSSFLSPEYPRTQQKDAKKLTTKLHRRGTEGVLDTDEKQAKGDSNEIEVKFNVPFEIGVKITAGQYQEYGQELERILEDILTGDPKEVQVEN
ncbi:PREDICTED: appetite-regulating hormone isoform X2 [Gavialis gangeticus]|uniref:appetite-regulating hormone isoform X2 n=1 Tax=Gavialis gangeticus TaxID=94835 RepID=UPI00092E911E|nr:PREDICTED: appetite-regulating hormone isoform X2 [Gavialis gangeticus]